MLETDNVSRHLFRTKTWIRYSAILKSWKSKYHNLLPFERFETCSGPGPNDFWCPSIIDDMIVIGSSTVRRKRYWITDQKIVSTYAILNLKMLVFGRLLFIGFLSIPENGIRGCLPTHAPTQKLKSRFSTFSSQGIGSRLVSFRMILKALQYESKIKVSFPKVPKSHISRISTYSWTHYQFSFAVLAMWWVFDKDQLCSLNRKNGWTIGFDIWSFCALIWLFRSGRSIFIFNYSIPRIVFYIKNLFSRNRIRENDNQNFFGTSIFLPSLGIYWKTMPVSFKFVIHFVIDFVIDFFSEMN